MQEIDNKTIYLNRGNVLNIILNIKQLDGTDYTFQANDKVRFAVYKKGKLEDDPVIEKEVTATSGQTTTTISLTSEETKIGDYINKPVDYWYEIELNGEYTIIGYDKNGAKIFRLMPEGKED